MSNRTVLLASLAVVLAVPAAAHACLADVPLEIIAGKADLILIAEVVNAGQPVQLQVNSKPFSRPLAIHTLWRTVILGSKYFICFLGVN